MSESSNPESLLLPSDSEKEKWVKYETTVAARNLCEEWVEGFRQAALEGSEEAAQDYELFSALLLKYESQIEELRPVTGDRAPFWERT